MSHRRAKRKRLELKVLAKLYGQEITREELLDFSRGRNLDKYSTNRGRSRRDTRGRIPL